MSKYLLGLDFGTDSSRAVVIDASNGNELASSTSLYRRWAEKRYCNSGLNIYRHHPQDYLESLEECARKAIEASGVAADIVAIAADTTASTVAITDRDGTPLALRSAYRDNPDAMFVLWKDHSSSEEAKAINEACEAGPVDYRKYTGGIYDCEWEWSKLMHCLKSSPEIRKDAWSFTELCDWIPAVLSGRTKPETMARCRCAAGHKGLWSEDWGGLPPMEFLLGICPELECLDGHLFHDTVTGGAEVGRISSEWASKLGLGEGVMIAMGGVDCHTGAVGAGIREGTLVKVVGTSTCDLCVAERQDSTVYGICGQIPGSILPGFIGMEAGQPAFGDIFAWFSRFCGQDIETLTAAAEKLPLKGTDIVAQDWFNGRRSPDVDPSVRAGVSGLTMATTPASFFKALVEGAAFGSRAIYERLTSEGVRIDEILAVGGIAGKSPFVMQTLSDVIGVPIKVPGCTQACALGAAMYASVAAGIHRTVPDAQEAMKPGISAVYTPSGERHSIYDTLYAKYKNL